MTADQPHLAARRGSGKTRLLIALAWAAFVVFAVHSLDLPGSVPRFREASGGGVLLDVAPSFHAETVFQRLEAYGEAGRAAYAFRLVTTDVLLPLSVLPFLFLFMRQAARRLALRDGIRRPLLTIPWAYVVFDLAENAVVFSLLSNHPARMLALASVLPYLTVIKRAASVAGLIVPAGLLAFAGLRDRHAKAKRR